MASSDEKIGPAELIDRARALRPVLQDRQEAAERSRRIPEETIADLRDAGLFRALQPRHHGGLEVALDDAMQIIMEIAAGCGSTGWVFAVMAMHQWQIGMFPPECQDDVWGDNPQALTASSFPPVGAAVAAEGGWRLDGSWPFTSGCDNADWNILGVRTLPAPGADPTGQGYVIIPKGDYTIEDKWHVVGLSGTGSKDVIVGDAFVPGHRLLTLPDALSGAPPGAVRNTGPLYRIPFFAAISTCLCAPVLGIAQGVLDDYVAETSGRMTKGAAIAQPRPMAELPTIHLRVAEAAAGIDAARLLLLRDCAELMETVAERRPLTELHRARNKGDLGYAVRLAKQATESLFESAGGHALYTSGRLQRAWRDLHAAAMHISLNWDASGALYGRVMLGQPAGPAQF